MTLGNIIRVEDIKTYIAKIPQDSKKEHIGKFIKIQTHDMKIVGVIENIVQTIREDIIPYIEYDMQPKYAPFNEDFRTSYYIIKGIGCLKDNNVNYEIYSPPDINDPVEALSDKELKEFHRLNNRPSMAYFNSIKDVFNENVLICMIEQIETQYPENRKMLNLIRKYVRRINK